MLMHCEECQYETIHLFVYKDPNTEKHCYQCDVCDERTEIDEDDSEFSTEWQTNNQ